MPEMDKISQLFLSGFRQWEITHYQYFIYHRLDRTSHPMFKWDNDQYQLVIWPKSFAFL